MTEIPFPDLSGGTTTVSLSEEKATFVVGPNGSGKSSLMQLVRQRLGKRAVWLTAHRAIVFTSDRLDLTPHTREQFWQQIERSDKTEQARYTDDQSRQRSQILMFDLIEAQRDGDAILAEAFRSGNLDLATQLKSEATPLQKLNDLFKSANLSINLSMGDKGRLEASKAGSEKYGINELSDGERSALIVSANIITAAANSVLLIDEPERHLHRSIVSPLITAALSLRKDCEFMISTHDVQLAVDQAMAQSLIIREYRKRPQGWEVEKLTDTSAIPDALLTDILCSRRNIVFVEGERTSLDKQLYELICPSASFKPAGTCRDVENATRGVAATSEHHRAKAFGIVDRDYRGTDDISKLRSANIYALPFYAVESLYYQRRSIEEVSKFSKSIGNTVHQPTDSVVCCAVAMIEKDVDRLSRLRATARLRRIYFGSFPREIDFSVEFQVHIPVDASSILDEERSRLESFIADRNLDEIVGRYKIRATSLPGYVAGELGFKSQQQFEGAVRFLTKEGGPLRAHFRELLADLIEGLEMEQA